MEIKKLSIAELISAVRHELQRVEINRSEQGLDPIFGLETMELTVKFVVTEDATVKGGFDLKVISLGGELKDSNQQVQELKLTYQLLPEAKGMPGTRAHPGNKPSDVSAIEPI